MPTPKAPNDPCLFQTNVDTLREGQTLLLQLTPDQYQQGSKPAFASTIGAHFRHVLEHYRCFLNRLEQSEICYDSRERDQRLEVDYAYAMQTIDTLIDRLSNLPKSDLNSRCEVRDMQSPFAVTSTLERELLFLQSHSTHHYAMIGAMARLIGVTPEQDFGVAIATRAHQHYANTRHSANV